MPNGNLFHFIVISSFAQNVFLSQQTKFNRRRTTVIQSECRLNSEYNDFNRTILNQLLYRIFTPLRMGLDRRNDESRRARKGIFLHPGFPFTPESIIFQFTIFKRISYFPSTIQRLPIISFSRAIVYKGRLMVSFDNEANRMAREKRSKEDGRKLLCGHIFDVIQMKLSKFCF